MRWHMIQIRMDLKSVALSVRSMIPSSLALRPMLRKTLVIGLAANATENAASNE